ncbi:guanylate kinase [Marivirga tractuosa]|uniref:Guanylate kinase n=1 Tax=Marivirga tractuosa (strain ATCC 23168 / DSM 4126 / NBRC 15989 / NCIMB 1408 / VKM B-1430 / H-43) TaxID=643867 RepID=E4TS70_MARTH|nr:guanylate kinase [Marivirga tractuosa]ADR21810.1 guanylate kinase [Marivirga tractuosa DSM 4126]BDD13732.1 guanylate kinase [Marivirga tractuosa]
MKNNGKAIIFSAPSGAGKTTIVQHLLDQHPELGFSISACTRDKRGRTEVDGVDYYFLTPEEFKKRIDKEEFVEWEEVYEGNFYGTLKEEVQRIWDSGRAVIFDVDVKGGLKLKKYFGDDALAVFVKVPSLEVLEERLKKRNSESSSSLSQRMYKAKFEMTFEKEFDVTLVNEDLPTSLKKAEDMVAGFIGK